MAIGVLKSGVNSQDVTASTGVDVVDTVNFNYKSRNYNLASLVAAAADGDIPLGVPISTKGYFEDSDIGGSTYQLIDAGSSGARPAEISGYVDHISGGSGGLYLAATDKNNVSLEQLGVADGADVGAKINILMSFNDVNRIYAKSKLSVVTSVGIDIVNKSVVIDFSNVSIKNNTAAPLIKFDGGIDFTRSVSSIVTATKRINCDESDFSVGDIIKVISDDRLPFTRPVSGSLDARMGQFFTVSTVNSGYITVKEKFNNAFATNIRVARLLGNTIKVIGGESSFDNSITTQFSGFYVANAVAPEFIDNSFGKMPFIGINLFGCYKPVVTRPHFKGTDFTTNLSHGVSLWSCAYPSINGLLANSARHSYTTNQEQIAAGSTDVKFYGNTYGLEIINPIADGEFITAFDTHHGVNGATISDAKVISSSGGAIGVRGNKITYNSPIVEHAATGILIYSEAGVAAIDYTSQVTMNNVDIHTDTEPFQIQRATKVKVSGRISADTFRAITATTSEVDFYNLTIDMTGSSEIGVSMIFCDASTLRFHGTTTINCTGHTGSASKLATLTGLNPSVIFGNNPLIINGGADFPDILFASASATNAKIDATNVVINSGPASISGVTGTFSTSSKYAFYGISNAQNFFNTITEAEVIGLANRSYPVTTVRCGAAANINAVSFEDGTFAGQVIELKNTTASFTITVTQGGNIDNTGAVDYVLPAKGVAQWRWVNSVWVQI